MQRLLIQNICIKQKIKQRMTPAICDNIVAE